MLRRSAIALMVVALAAGCGRNVPPLPDTPAIDTAAAAADLVKSHNEVRVANGLAPLTLHPTLQYCAESHSADMAEHTFMSHTGSDWSTPFQRMSRNGYKYRSAGENVAAGQGSVSQVMNTWMGSFGHRANILGRQYKDIGAAVRLSKGGTPYWTVTFGASQ